MKKSLALPARFMTSSTRLLAVAAVTLGGFVVSSANAQESTAEPEELKRILKLHLHSLH